MITILSYVASWTAGIAVLLGMAFGLRAMVKSKASREAAEDLARLVNWASSKGQARMPTIPRLSISATLVGFAINRLPEAMTMTERERWAEEMTADVSAVTGCIRRLLCAFRLWRKGAPQMPVGREQISRSAVD
jgi:hypothetical protein